MPAIAAAAAPLVASFAREAATQIGGAVIGSAAQAAQKQLTGKLEGSQGGAEANHAAGEMQGRAKLPGAEGQPQTGGLLGKLEQGLIGKLKEGAQELKSALDKPPPMLATLRQDGQKIESAVGQKSEQLQAMLHGTRA
jgi:hypothetical protein